LRSGMIERILPASVVAAEVFGDYPAAELFREEKACIAGAVESRHQEFATARACAHAALDRLGVPLTPVLSDPLGAPQWPAGVAGSITHCEGYRAAAVARTTDVKTLGINAEPDAALPDADMVNFIACDSERAHLVDLAGDTPGICWDRLLFSAKESACKAWFPLARCRLDFESADIVIDAGAGTFAVEISVPGPLTSVSGRWLASQGLLVTAIVLPA
jgi:4'-phosphopantetheinyl transferase EntD